MEEKQVRIAHQKTSTFNYQAEEGEHEFYAEIKACVFWEKKDSKKSKLLPLSMAKVRIFGSIYLPIDLSFLFLHVPAKS